MSMFGKTNIRGLPNGHRDPDWLIRQRREAREYERVRKQMERERKADERKRKAAQRERDRTARDAQRTTTTRNRNSSYNLGNSSWASPHSRNRSANRTTLSPNSTTYSRPSTTANTNISNTTNLNHPNQNQPSKPTVREYVSGVIILIIGIVITVYSFVDMVMWNGGFFKTWFLAVAGIFTGIYGLARMGK